MVSPSLTSDFFFSMTYLRVLTYQITNLITPNFGVCTAHGYQEIVSIQLTLLSKEGRTKFHVLFDPSDFKGLEFLTFFSQ